MYIIIMTIEICYLQLYIKTLSKAFQFFSQYFQLRDIKTEYNY